MKNRVLLFCLMLLSIDVYGQQIAEIDLVAHQPPKKLGTQISDMALAGCESPFYNHSDGAIVKTEARSKLRLELTLAKQAFHRGEIVDANVLMRNAEPQHLDVCEFQDQDSTGSRRLQDQPLLFPLS